MSMSLISISFLLFFTGILLVYYLVPGKLQWVVLLAASILFYFLAATPYTFVYLVLSIVSVYWATRRIDSLDVLLSQTEGKEEKQRLMRARKRSYLAGVTVCVGMLAALKYMNFFLGNVRMAAGLFGKGFMVPEVHWIASLGISFYTLQMVGYLTDVYWGISKCQKNIARLALFNCYFPQMISGPISRYHELEDTLFGTHKFEGKRVYQGILRILIGFFKKLVVSEHLIHATEAVFANPAEYGGIFVWIGTALYVIQIYADFAGCMDIIMGVSECFGVALPENFKTPFGSTTIQEFWQRWHITLGAWLKDYVMYPILRSGLWSKYAKGVKKRWGKRAAKLLPTFTGMLILWFGMGLWHGGGWNYIGEGIWFWLVIVLGQTLEPWFKRAIQKCRIHAEGKLWYCFRCVRTTFIYAVGALFFKADSLRTALHMLGDAFSPTRLAQTAREVMPVLSGIRSSVGTTQLAWTAFSVIVGTAMMAIWGRMEKRGSAFKDWLPRHSIFVNGLIIYLLLFTILLLGAYGPGYSASEFIYGGF